MSPSPIARSQNNIDHFPGGDEVNLVFAWGPGPFHQFTKKVLNRRAKHRRLVTRNHAMAVKFDKDPVGSPTDSDRCFSPQLQSTQRGWIVSGQLTVLDP